jgi:integrase
VASVWKRRADKKDPTKPWQITFTTESGKPRTVVGLLDKRESLRLGARLEDDADKRRRGLSDDRAESMAVQAKRPIGEHLTEYAAHLSSKGNTARHNKETLAMLRRMVAACHWTAPADVDATRAVGFLNAIRAKGRSACSFNAHRTALRGFSRWLWTSGRLASDPLVGLPRQNQTAAPVNPRRALDDDEARRLLAAAERGPRAFALTGPDRAALYRASMVTGFRRGELASLTPQSFDLDADPPTVTVEAGYSKRRRRDVQPLRADVAEWFRGFLRGKPRGVPVWGSAVRTGDMVRADLRRAKAQWIRETPDRGTRRERRDADFLSERDSAGRVADFHAAGRHTYITRLGRAGVSMKVAQGLARHSTINLTAGYTHMGLSDHTAALDSLPALDMDPATERPTQAATGTDGKPVEDRARSAGAAPSAAKGGSDRHGPAVAGRIGGDGEWTGTREKTRASGNARHSAAAAGTNTGSRSRTHNLLIRSQVLYPVELCPLWMQA